MKNEVLSMVGAVALTLALSACGDNGDKTPTTPTTATAAPAAASAATKAAADMTAAVKDQAEKLLTDAANYIKENKLDLADKAVTQLEQMKPQLPAEYGPRIDDLRKAVNALKTTGGIKLPGQ